jgi:hypothetical protein
MPYMCGVSQKANGLNSPPMRAEVHCRCNGRRENLDAVGGIGPRYNSPPPPTYLLSVLAKSL